MSRFAPIAPIPPIVIMILGPARSTRTPLINWPTAYPAVKAVAISPTLAADTPNSLWIKGSAMAKL